MPQFHNGTPWRRALARRRSRITLYSRPECPYSPIVRGMLDHKQLTYRNRDLIPGPHATIVKAMGFPKGTVPALKIAGQRVQSTIEATHLIEAVSPSRPLLPQDPEHRAAVEETIDWAREQIPTVKNDLYWWGMHNDPAAAIVLWENARTGVPKLILRRAVPRSVKAMGRSEPPDSGAGLRCLARVPDMLRFIDQRIDAGVIGDDEPNAGDFHAAMVARLLMSLADLASLVAARPAGRLAARIYTAPIAQAAPFLTPEQMSSARLIPVA